MKYEEMTDFELEAKLCELVTGITPIKKPSGKQRVYIAWEDDGVHQQIVDIPAYCKDWNATMPMAIKYKLWLQPASFGDEWHSFTTTNRSYSDNVNPLRAIVICLIKVLEAENANR